MALRDIEERHTQLLGLEKNIEELGKMFVDLATLSVCLSVSVSSTGKYEEIRNSCRPQNPY